MRESAGVQLCQDLYSRSRLDVKTCVLEHAWHEFTFVNDAQSRETHGIAVTVEQRRNERERNTSASSNEGLRSSTHVGSAGVARHLIFAHPVLGGVSSEYGTSGTVCFCAAQLCRSSASRVSECQRLRRA